MVSLVEEKAKRKFKNPVVRFRAKRVVAPTSPFELLQQNAFRIRAILKADSTDVWISHDRAAVNRGPDRNTIGAFVAVGGDQTQMILTTQEAVWCKGDAGTEEVYVWEEYWAEGGDES